MTSWCWNNKKAFSKRESLFCWKNNEFWGYSNCVGVITCLRQIKLRSNKTRLCRIKLQDNKTAKQFSVLPNMTFHRIWDRQICGRMAACDGARRRYLRQASQTAIGNIFQYIFGLTKYDIPYQRSGAKRRIPFLNNQARKLSFARLSSTNSEELRVLKNSSFATSIIGEAYIHTAFS